jgi:hypothetical protein
MKPAIVVVSGLLQSPFKERSILKITGLVQRTLNITSALQGFTVVFSVPPGTHSIRFTAEGKALRPPGDPRTMYFRLILPEASDWSGVVEGLEDN